VAKIVYFNIQSSGHVNPSIPIITELVKRGEHVIYYNMEEIRPLIEPTGAEFRPYQLSLDVETLERNAGTGSFMDNALMFTRLGEELLPSLIADLKREQPDAIIHDSLASWGKLAAQAVGQRTIGAMSTFVITAGNMPPMPPRAILDLAGSMVRVMPEYNRLAARMRKQFNVKPLGLMGALMSTGDISLVFTSREFQPNGHKLDDSYKFVGPQMRTLPPSDFPLDQLTGKPLIYISLGTIKNDNVDFYRQCFTAFADHPGTFVMSVGKRVEMSSLGTIPDNFRVFPFVPQVDLLAKTDLFITHGGMNSVHEGLYNGVPLVVLPQQAEQALVARQVERNGAGIALATKPPFGKVTVAELRGAVDQVLASDAYRKAAIKLGESLKAAGGPSRAADEIMAFARERVTVS
jgi:MGT family glycosyltransferase